MNLRILAAKLHEWFQRRGRLPGEPGPGQGAFRFVYAIVYFVVIGLIYAMGTCAKAEATDPAPGANRTMVAP
jgi:hypothetical protein